LACLDSQELQESKESEESKESQVSPAMMEKKEIPVHQEIQE
jgi:hypothetical protein